MVMIEPLRLMLPVPVENVPAPDCVKLPFIVVAPVPVDNVVEPV